MAKYNLDKAILFRFIRGFIAGFVGTAVSLAPFAGNSFNELSDWLFGLAIAGVVGGISGGLLALDKYFRAK